MICYVIAYAWLFELTIAQRSPYAGRGPYHRFRATPVPLPNVQLPAVVANVAIASSASATQISPPAATVSSDVPRISQLPLTQSLPETFPFKKTSQSNEQHDGFLQRDTDEKSSTSTMPSISPLANSAVNKRNNFSVSRPVAVVVKPARRIPFIPRPSPHNRNFDDDFSEYDYGFDRDNNQYAFYN